MLELPNMQIELYARLFPAHFEFKSPDQYPPADRKSNVVIIMIL